VNCPGHRGNFPIDGARIQMICSTRCHSLSARLIRLGSAAKSDFNGLTQPRFAALHGFRVTLYHGASSPLLLGPAADQTLTYASAPRTTPEAIRTHKSIRATGRKDGDR
jgi:hypothetical protein